MGMFKDVEPDWDISEYTEEDTVVDTEVDAVVDLCANLWQHSFCGEVKKVETFLAGLPMEKCRACNGRAMFDVADHLLSNEHIMNVASNTSLPAQTWLLQNGDQITLEHYPLQVCYTPVTNWTQPGGTLWTWPQDQ